MNLTILLAVSALYLLVLAVATTTINLAQAVLWKAFPAVLAFLLGLAAFKVI